MNDLVVRATRPLRSEQFRELYRHISDQIGQGLVILPSCVELAETNDIWYPLWKIAPNRNQAALVITNYPNEHPRMEIMYYDRATEEWTKDLEGRNQIDSDLIAYWRPLPDWPEEEL